MEIEHHLAWRTNSKRYNYEDRYLIPLGELPDRLEQADDRDEQIRLGALLESRKARGLLFAVLDGVGGAPLGMAAAQATVDELRTLYSASEFAPRDGFPGAKQVLDLIYRANDKVHGWGFTEEPSSGATKPKGATCLSAVYISPAGNVTMFQAGDTAIFIHRAALKKTEIFTGHDVAGKAVRRYIGLGPKLEIDTKPIVGLQPGDLLALVTDGVYPKGFRAVHDVEALLRDSGGDPEFAAKELAARASNRGSNDDITALVIAIN